MADVFKKPIDTINSSEGPALGAALIAGVGSGTYKNIEEACDLTIKTNTHIDPDLMNSIVYDEYYREYTKLYKSLKDNFSRLALLNKRV